MSVVGGSLGGKSPIGGALIMRGDARPALARAGVGGAALLFAVAACSSGGYGSGDSNKTTPAPSGSGPVTTVQVQENEYHISLSQSAFPAGRYSFVVNDTGQADHALSISGPNLSKASTKTVEPGAKTQLDVTLQPGTYKLWCPVDGHEQLGMTATITVTGAAVPTPSGTGGAGGGY